MGWFKRSTPPAHTPEEKRAIVEIEAHQDAKKEAIMEAKVQSENLNKLLIENGFTMQIFKATGGKLHRKGKA